MLRVILRTIQWNNSFLTQYQYQSVAAHQIRKFSDKPENVDQSQDSEKLQENKLGAFAKAFKELDEIANAPAKEPVAQAVPFKKLLRNSKFIDLGDPLNKIVSGRIVHVVDQDLYIDFGWKFNCVCKTPEKSGHLYVRGATVKLKIKDLELSSRFLGETKDLTILEADCELLGLISSPKLKSK